MTKILRSIGLILILLFSSPIYAGKSEPVTLKILGINDFHGQITAGRMVNNRPVGSAPVLASYLKQAEKKVNGRVVYTIMGDLTGASPPASGLLHDEPTILFMNSLVNAHCKPEHRMDERCNMVATLGNHEFDRGPAILHELMYGSEKPPTDRWIDMPTFPGAYFPYISANIADSKDRPAFAPYKILNVDGVRMGFIGAILKDAADIIMPHNREGLHFTDEVDAINQSIRELKKQGVKIMVVIMHQGGQQGSYEGDTKPNTKVSGAVVEIVKRLDDGVEVVMAGHTHQFLNAYLPNANGNKVLVTEAYSYNSGFADVTLKVDRDSHKVLDKSARIITTYADAGPGKEPDKDVAKIIKLAEDSVAPKVNRELGTLANDLSKGTNGAGESALGNLVTDGMRQAMQADIAFMNIGGIRTSLSAGKITWGTIYAMQPFSNDVVSLTLTGKDIRDLLEQQWMLAEHDRILQVSGLRYRYDLTKPVGSRVQQIYVNDKPLQLDKRYIVATNNFLMLGGDGFTVFQRGSVVKVGDHDNEVTSDYIAKLPQPFNAKIDGRIEKM